MHRPADAGVALAGVPSRTRGKSVGKSESEIERLVEAQARGEPQLNPEVPVEQTPPPVAELDKRRSKSSLAAGLAAGALASSTDSDPSAVDPGASPNQAQPGVVPAPDPAQPVPPVSGPAAIDRQDLDLARDLPVPSD